MINVNNVYCKKNIDPLYLTEIKYFKLFITMTFNEYIIMTLT